MIDGVQVSHDTVPPQSRNTKNVPAASRTSNQLRSRREPKTLQNPPPIGNPITTYAAHILIGNTHILIGYDRLFHPHVLYRTQSRHRRGVWDGPSARMHFHIEVGPVFPRALLGNPPWGPTGPSLGLREERPCGRALFLDRVVPLRRWRARVKRAKRWWRGASSDQG